MGLVSEASREFTARTMRCVVLWCVCALGGSGLSLWAQAPDAREKVTLQARFEAGEIRVLQVVTEQTLVQGYLDRQLKSAQEMRVNLVAQTREVNADGSAWLVLRYEAMRLRLEVDGSIFEFDSSRPVTFESPLGSALAVLVGQSVMVRVTPQWRVVEVRGLDPLWSTMMGLLNSPILQDDLRRTLSGHFDDAGLSGILQRAGSWCPEETMELGQSWSFDESVSAWLPMRVAGKMTLAELTKETATIHLEGAISADPRENLQVLGRQRVTGELIGRQTGDFVVDRGDGWLRSGEVNQRLSGKMRFFQPETSGGNREIQLTLSTRVQLLGALREAPQQIPARR